MTWLARIDADADIQKLREKIAARASREGQTQAERVAQLSGRAVAVVGFVDAAPSADSGWIGAGLAEVFTNDLVQHTSLLVVERANVSKVLKENAGDRC